MVPTFKKIAGTIKSALKPLFKPLIKPLISVALALVLVFGLQNHDAFAARSGGRMGGSSFRAPSRSYRTPTRTNGGAMYGGGYGYGGGFGLPFMYGLGFGGGGGMFSLLITLAIAGFLFRTFQNTFGSDAGSEENPGISVAKVQVGLMAQARNLQLDLDRIAFNADTNTESGRAKVLQEVSLTLLRHPEYWVYGSVSTDTPKLSGAEAVFNRLTMAERSKFSEETLSNINGQVKQPKLAGADQGGTLTPQSPAELLAMNADAEYIVVTLLVATTAKLQLPKINGENDMKQALQQIGSLAAGGLLAIEVVWTPQADGDCLTSDDIMASYPDMKLV
jgi:uncharacterized membrane protein